jgi:hypothetical protein
MSQTTPNANQDDGISRRRFIEKTVTAAGALALPTIIPASALGKDGHVAPSNRITMAQIGLGRMGRGHTRFLAYEDSVEMLAVCDVDQTRREATLSTISNVYKDRKLSCKAYNDYRDVLARDDIDAVVIVTPDHWHTPISIDAAKAGKDIYCEKPISLTVREGRELVETVRRNKRIFQTGTQYRSIPPIRQVSNFVRNGGLGQVKSVFTLWKNWKGRLQEERFKPYHKFINMEAASRSFIPLSLELPAKPVPEGLDWERWVGPAAWHDYNQLYHVNPFDRVVPWSFEADFGAGAVTGYHSHAADVIQYALGVERSGPVEFIHPNDGPYPTLTCRYENGTLLHLVENWEDVKRLYQAVPDTARLEGNFGGVFVGENGWVTSMSTGGEIEAGPEDLFTQMNLKTRRVNIGDNDHHANWLECIRTRQQPSTDEELGHRTATLGHLTIIAYKLQRSLKWDPVKEEFPGDAEANRLLWRARRV